ncbi:hypothetical protein G6F43_012702 [Rhizopus delemar]|nr:hypothetical protein G6F43_012702 [Rhizopus delemar]
MDIDTEAYPIDYITNFDEHLDCKPPEKTKGKPHDEKQSLHEKPNKKNENEVRAYRKHGDGVKEQLFFLVYEKAMTPGQAAKQLGVNRRMAYNWVKKDQENPSDILEPNNGKKVGRPSILNEEHKRHLVSFYDDNPSAVVDQAMDSLTSEFTGLKIGKTSVYNFMTRECNLTFKKAHMHSIQRNSPDNIERRYEWVLNWVNETDMDYMSNCVFIDEAAFHINLKRSMAWPKKGTRAEVIVPETRARTTTILGAISPFGVVNVQLRRPTIPSKKRRLGSNGLVVSGAGGTVTGYYINFIKSTLDVLDNHEEFKGHYIVMDNAPIHTSKDIERYITSRGYGCIYLPPYSPELNPIEQFWSVVKSKLKREKLLEKETISSRIKEACNSILFSDLRGFCHYSTTKFNDCLEKKHL